MEGGTQNDYVYPLDPINTSDFSGRWLWAVVGIITIVVAATISIISAIDNHNNGNSDQAKQDVVDAIGAVCDVCDVVNGASQLIRGDIGNGLLSLGAAVPIVGTPLKSAVKNVSKLANAAPAVKVLKSDSVIWRNLTNLRDGIKTNGLRGKDKKFYTWDHTHNDIEMFDHRGYHEGTIDPVTGNLIKPAVPGRNIKNNL